MKRYYYWLDGFDGGTGSGPFNTFEEAKADAIRHAHDDIRLTERELAQLVKKHWNYVFIGYTDFDDDADEDDIAKGLGDFMDEDGIELNQDTLHRIY